jgi:hypothetical protein
MEHQISIRLYTDEYYLALGKFIVEYSELEQSMQVGLWILTKMANPIAKAIFSGVRADDACNKITRLGQVEKWSKIRNAEWKTISDRLGILRTLRNDILHYGVEWQIPDGGWITTNKNFAHIVKKITTTPVSVPILTAATADVRKLSLHLFNFIFDDGSPTRQRVLAQELQNAWQYKPSRRAGHAGRSQRNSPKRSPRPRSSPG